MRKKYSIAHATKKAMGFGDEKYPNRGHDVVILKHHLFKNTYEVATITSLSKNHIKAKSEEDIEAVRKVEKFSPWKSKQLKKAVNGNIIPIPTRYFHTKHWSGVNICDPHTVKGEDISDKKICMVDEIPSTYRRLLKLGLKLH